MLFHYFKLHWHGISAALVYHGTSHIHISSLGSDRNTPRAVDRRAKKTLHLPYLRPKCRGVGNNPEFWWLNHFKSTMFHGQINKSNLHFLSFWWSNHHRSPCLIIIISLNHHFVAFLMVELSWISILYFIPCMAYHLPQSAFFFPGSCVLSRCDSSVLESGGSCCQRRAGARPGGSWWPNKEAEKLQFITVLVGFCELLFFFGYIINPCPWNSFSH